MPELVKVFAPATCANVAVGFDVLGFAVDQPGDEVVIRKSNQKGIRITKIEGDGGKLPTEAEENTVSISIIKLLEHLNIEDIGMEIELKKMMPLGSGLGSSAASTVAGVVAANELLGCPLTREELLPFAMEGERLACGAAHADNVAPALLGGFVLIRSYSPLDVVKLPTPDDLYATIVHPHIEVRTKDARNILPQQVWLSDAVTQWGNLGGLVAGLYTNDYELIGRSLNDVIVEPKRAILIPGFKNVKAATLKAGALGASISGSGPSIFALSKGETTAKLVADAMTNTFSSLDIESDVYISKVNQAGPLVIESK